MSLLIKPHIDGVAKVASNKYQRELDAISFQSHCLQERRWKLEAAITTVQELGLEMSDFCELQACIQFGEFCRNLGQVFRYGKRDRQRY